MNDSLQGGFVRKLACCYPDATWILKKNQNSPSKTTPPPPQIVTHIDGFRVRCRFRILRQHCRPHIILKYYINAPSTKLRKNKTLNVPQNNSFLIIRHNNVPGTLLHSVVENTRGILLSTKRHFFCVRGFSESLLLVNYCANFAFP